MQVIALVSGENLGLSLTLLGWPLLATLISVGAVAIGPGVNICPKNGFGKYGAF